MSIAVGATHGSRREEVADPEGVESSDAGDRSTPSGSAERNALTPRCAALHAGLLKWIPLGDLHAIVRVLRSIAHRTE